MKPKGILYTKSGEKIERIAESVILISSSVPSKEVASSGFVFVDNDVLSNEVYINMIGELLVIMEEQGGENFVAQAIAHYAKVTNKVIQSKEGSPDFVYIRGRKKSE